ncbi:MAG TPA: hypothetical protein VGR76_18555 [Candidatus Angelobacter sp.]|nr:hypothetical protein [Candidatus Angelobacter sp.]
MRYWRNSHGDVMSVAIVGSLMGFPHLSNVPAWQKYARGLAESRTAGLIEVRPSSGKNGAGMALIYKRNQKAAYFFTGMLIVPRGDASQIWTAVAGECGTTGVREAVITKELFDSGAYTIEDYRNSFAQDPYEPGYQGVDRSLLRFFSDDERYDERFPHHPLSRIRQTLAALPESVAVISRIT